jgi:hypothetical protein
VVAADAYLEEFCWLLEGRIGYPFYSTDDSLWEARIDNDVGWRS